MTSGPFAEARALYAGAFDHSGLLNTDPEANTLAVLLDEAKILASNRDVFAGATDLQSGLFVEFNKTKDNALHAALASSAVPGVFETRTYQNVTYSDGMCKRNVPVIQAVRRCIDLGFSDIDVTVLLVVDPSAAPQPDYSTATTLSVMERTFRIFMQYFAQFDVQAAKAAFPEANIKVISPSAKLPGTSDLQFNTTCMQEMIQIGIKDGVAAAKKSLKERSEEMVTVVDQ